MNWQYRTILFEFQKDGLLGDRYIDDDEMEKVFNEQGSKGWELVNVTPVQEGLLSFFKRVLPQLGKKVSVKSGDLSESSVRNPVSSDRPVLKKPVPREKTAVIPANRPAEKPGSKPNVVGEIKIS